MASRQVTYCTVKVGAPTKDDNQANKCDIEQIERNAFTCTEVLYNAILSNDLKKTERLLKEGIFILPDLNGNRIFHETCERRNFAMIRLLLRMTDLDLNAVNQVGQTVLHRAASTGDMDLLQLLVNFGADVNRADRLTASTPLHLTAQYGHAELTTVLLTARCSLNAKNQYGDTALHTATRYGHTSVCRLLLNQRGIQLDEVNANQDTALHIAVALHRRAIFNLLLTAILDPDVDINEPFLPHCRVNIIEQRNSQGETPLDLAERKGRPEMVEVLLAGSTQTLSRNSEIRKSCPRLPRMNMHAACHEPVFNRSFRRKGAQNYETQPIINLNAANPNRNSIKRRGSYLQHAVPPATNTNREEELAVNKVVTKMRSLSLNTHKVMELKDSGLSETPGTADVCSTEPSKQSSTPSAYEVCRFGCNKRNSMAHIGMQQFSSSPNTTDAEDDLTPDPLELYEDVIEDGRMQAQIPSKVSPSNELSPYLASPREFSLQTLCDSPNRAPNGPTRTDATPVLVHGRTACKVIEFDLPSESKTRRGILRHDGEHRDQYDTVPAFNQRKWCNGASNVLSSEHAAKRKPSLFSNLFRRSKPTYASKPSKYPTAHVEPSRLSQWWTRLFPIRASIRKSHQAVRGEQLGSQSGCPAAYLDYNLSKRMSLFNSVLGKRATAPRVKRCSSEDGLSTLGDFKPFNSYSGERRWDWMIKHRSTPVHVSANSNRPHML